MSVVEFRERLKARIRERRDSIAVTILAGSPKEYPVYRDLAGYHRALREVDEIIIDQVFTEMFSPTPGETAP